MSGTTPERPFALDTHDKHLPKAALFALVALLLLTTFLGARGLNADPVWNDEMISMTHVNALKGHFNPVDTWHSVKDRSKAHSPGYFLLLGTWGSLVGWTPAALRYLSLLGGLLGVAFTYRLGRDAVSWRVGFYSAALLGTSAFFIYYMHELRMYSLIVTTSVFALWSYHHIDTRRRAIHVAEWIMLFFGALLPLYTHHFSALILGVIGGYHMTFALNHLVIQPATRNRPRWVLMLVVIGLAGLCFLPWLRTVPSGINAAHGASPTLEDTALAPVPLVRAMLDRFGNGWALFPAAGIVLAAAAGLTTRKGTVFLWAAAVALLIGVLGVNIVEKIIPMRRLRYLLVMWPPLALLVGMGLASLRRWRVIGAGLLIVWMVIGVNASLGRAIVDDQGGADEMFPVHKVANTLETRITAEDALIVFGEYADQWGTAPDYYLAPLTPAYMFVDDDIITGLDSITALAFAHDRIWIVTQSGDRTQRLEQFEAVLSDDYLLTDTFSGPDELRAELYTRQ